MGNGGFTFIYRKQNLERVLKSERVTCVARRSGIQRQRDVERSSCESDIQQADASIAHSTYVMLQNTAIAHKIQAAVNAIL